MKLVFVTAEAGPFVKTGGLGEVMGSLPTYLHNLGLDVRVIMPNYSAIPERFQSEFRHLAQFDVQLAWRQQYCGLKEFLYQGVHYYFLDNEYYFSRSQIYGEYDDAERFAFFSRAALESLIHIPEFKPDIIHCHDWHSALIPLMLKQFYDREPLYYPIKTVFTIHNLKYQGIFPEEVLENVVGLGREYFTESQLEFYGGVNFMKAGLLYADRITTVSPTYGEEIKDPYYGEKLDGILKARSASLTGILNGIDYQVYDPLRDPYLKMPFTDVALAKQENKKHLQQIMNLPVNGEKALLGMVTRLTDQKGLDLLAHVIEELLMLDVQLVVLGTGEPAYEAMLSHFASTYPEKLAVKLTFSDQIAHEIYGGADMLLMPSRFEPCGIAQMIAMRYGTVPIVRATGGLKDTVIPYNPETGTGNGFNFVNYNAHDFLYTVQRAVQLYQNDPTAWQVVRLNALNCDFSWERSAQAYLEIYEDLL